VNLLQRIARTLHVLLTLGIASVSGAAIDCAYPQTASPTQSSAPSAAAANAAPGNQAEATAADPHIDKAQIAQRLNRELDFNLETTTGEWQHALDRVDGELARPRLRYTELNRLRDDLLRVRSDVAGAFGKIQPRLDADRDQIKLLGAAPAAGAPPEPEQATRNRAELNYHFGLLSAAEATANSTNLRIDNLLDKIQDIRRKNFTSALFQPIPGMCRNTCRTPRTAFATWSRFGGPTRRIAATSPVSGSKPC
jgi:potassium-dependent mechanosensitive channel